MKFKLSDFMELDTTALLIEMAVLHIMCGIVME